MPNRRDFLAALGAASLGVLPLPAIVRSSRAAETGPLRIGWIPALTGPGSAPGIGFDRGTTFAIDAINAAGGVNGHPIELVRRDTQGDPTKAVNATVELISREKVAAIWGPVNSGEALAVTPITARSRTPLMHACVTETLIDPVKYPNAFRMAPSNSGWQGAVRRFAMEALKLKKIAVVGDTTGYGTTAVQSSVADFQKAGAEVVYQGLIESTATDVTADILRMKNAGAEIVVPWSVTTGWMARLLNTRGAQGWDVPFAGHPSLGSGEVRSLLAKPEYWDKVYQVGYRSCSYGADGALPARSRAFVDQLKGKVSLNDTLLWWVAGGYDVVHMVAEAVEKTGSTENTAIIGYWNTLKARPGIFGDYTYTAQDHNGYPENEVVMSIANSFREGAFAMAPGYS